MSRALSVLLALYCIYGGLGQCAAAADSLAYTNRSLAYDGLGTTARGNIRTVGMAGAVVGLADTFLGAQQNPAGLAMTLYNADIQITTNRFQDRIIQGDDTALYTFNSGLAIAPYPWGFSMGVVTAYTEGREFAQGLAANSVREVRFSIARGFFSDRLSIGASAVIGQNELIMGSKGYSAFAPGFTFGIQTQFPHRFLWGASFTTAMQYPGFTAGDSGVISQFFQDTIVPMRVGTGIGWIPNRFFRLGASVMAYGPNERAALVRSENERITAQWTIQPQFGLNYLWMDFAEFRSTFTLGTYLETPRVVGTPLRPHATVGLEAVPWVLIAAAGADVAPGYLNFMLGFGVDLVRIFEKMDLIPSRYMPPKGGIFPRIAQLSDEGLARPLVKNWVQKGPVIDPIQAGMNLPSRVEQKARKIGEGVSEVFSAEPEHKSPRHSPKKGDLPKSR